MNSKNRIQTSLNHQCTDRVPIDFGATTVTGIHCKIVAELRRQYGLEDKPVKITDPFQMLGEVDEELLEIIGIDAIGISGMYDIFNNEATNFHEQLTPWGQKVLIPKGIDLQTDKKGDIYIHAYGDTSYPPSAKMPDGCYFVNAIERQLPIDDEKMDPLDNIEEYGLISDTELNWLAREIDLKATSGKAIVAGLGGTALGDVAFIPGMGLKEPKGIRSVAEWYMSTIMRQDYIHQVFDKQITIAIQNYKKIWDLAGDKIDVVFTCGTDFGSQDSQFCSPETFHDLWLPHYKRMNDWIHQNTSWKIFKHSCGAIIPILPGLIEAGFDIINPVQINAKGMTSEFLKQEYGKDLVFWGGGIDTQKILPYGSPEQVYEHVIKQCEFFGKDGGFVFNAVHNIQANVPIKNVIAMIDALSFIKNKKNISHE